MSIDGIVSLKLYMQINSKCKTIQLSFLKVNFFHLSYHTSSLVEWLELWVYPYKIYVPELESIQGTSRSCSMDIVKLDAVQLYIAEKAIRL